MADIGEFSGFSPKGIGFLKALEENNNREWFNEHKSDFKEHVTPPSQSFVKTLGERLSDALDGIIFDPSTRAGSSLMRIYRDVRFSRDKTPYNPRLGFIFWEDGGKRMERPGFLVRLDAHGGQVMGGMYRFPKPVLKSYRKAVASEETGGMLVEAIRNVESQEGFEVGGTHYKRVPKGYDAEHPRAKLLLHNGLYASSPKIRPSLLTRSELVDVCFEYCKKISPIYGWLVSLL
ncbi:DUF2461 domain-containing protein [Candidatus Thorarchaeota archaeon]|jgi:uncharacterized protein (TIGR02453 family)|nr:MAG: DUF2461 domain-containing protein [Candidatus Thorarchaeota archaeon]